MSLRAFGLLALSALIASCVRLSQPAPTVREFRLDYPPPVITETPLPVTIGVPPLGVATIYDREPIVYRDDAYATGTYPYDRWSANPGSMVADLLARDLAAAEVYRAVQQGPSVLPSDFQLTGEIEEMEERTTEYGCRAHLRLRMLLVRTRATHSDPVLLQRTYTEDEPCRCNDPHALAAAMSDALERLSMHLQGDIHDALASALTRPDR
jgi:ABC-type uncharacterized transport system auxiliary subunit